MNFLLMTGIGDSVWALTKIQAVRDRQEPGGSIDISLVGSENSLDTRAVDFLERFSFVDSVNMRAYEVHDAPYIRPDGCYNYRPDGIYEYNGTKYCLLAANEALERGVRLEKWLPHYPIRWDIWDDFRISDAERKFADSLFASVGPYAVFYPGPLNGNTEDGHNRGALWKPEDWVALARRVHQEFGLQIVLVGAPYDMSYYQWLLGPALNGDVSYVHNLIGQTNLGQLWSVTARAKFTISFQAGVGIVNTMMGNNTACWWRPYGDSISSSHFLSFNEGMASAWVPPKILESGSYFPMIYSRHGVSQIMDAIRERSWA